MNKEEVLNALIIEGNIVKLPNVQLDRKAYLEIKNALEKIGGKWKGSKVQGFVFEEDPTDYINDLVGGKERNIKKEFQFFPTPLTVATEMGNWWDIKHKTILEPSAGDGALIKGLMSARPSFASIVNRGECTIDVCELMELNRKKLKELPVKVNIVAHDFLNLPTDNKYDFIIANPPFTKNQDIDHVMKMWEHLNDDGVLISIISTHYKHSTRKKEKEFKDFIEVNNLYIIPLESGTFKESKTNIETEIVILTKR